MLEKRLKGFDESLRCCRYYSMLSIFNCCDLTENNFSEVNMAGNNGYAGN